MKTREQLEAYLEKLKADTARVQQVHQQSAQQLDALNGAVQAIEFALKDDEAGEAPTDDD